MKEQFDHAHFRNAIVTEQERLADLESRGVEALSTWDRHLATVWNGEEAMLDLSKTLVRNHIIYFQGKLEELGEEPPQQGVLFEVK